MVNEKYLLWIEKYESENNILGKCKEACELMIKEFPELTITNGFVQSSLIDIECDIEEGYEHWWCKDNEGNIIDPTRSQYRLVEPINYVEIDDNHPARNMPRKHCPNCGKYFYGDSYLCSEECELEYIEYTTGANNNGGN
jgi:hypothetical protein